MTQLHIHSPSSSAQAAEIVLQAAQEKKTLIPCGRQSHVELFAHKNPKSISLISTAALNAIQEYLKENLSIQIQVGLTLGELQEYVLPDGLFLPLTQPGYERRTIGSLIVEGAIGLESLQFGSIEDSILGLEFVSPMGKIIHTGGKTVKNVSGYDFTRLFSRSWGTLGLITSATLRLQPCLESVFVIQANARSLQSALETMLKVKALNLSLLTLQIQAQLQGNSASFKLVVRLGGFDEALKEQVRRVKALFQKYFKDIFEIKEENQGWPHSLEHRYEQHQIRSHGSLSSIIKLASSLEYLICNREVTSIDFDLGKREMVLSFSDYNTFVHFCRSNPMITENNGVTFEISGYDADQIFARLKSTIDPRGTFPSWQMMKSGLMHRVSLHGN